MTRSKSDIISPERIYTPIPINILCETRILKCNSVETFIKGLTRPNYPKKAYKPSRDFIRGNQYFNASNLLLSYYSSLGHGVLAMEM